jgi:hypothetical protein
MSGMLTVATGMFSVCLGVDYRTVGCWGIACVGGRESIRLR